MKHIAQQAQAPIQSYMSHGTHNWLTWFDTGSKQRIALQQIVGQLNLLGSVNSNKDKSDYSVKENCIIPGYSLSIECYKWKNKEESCCSNKTWLC